MASKALVNLTDAALVNTTDAELLDNGGDVLAATEAPDVAAFTGSAPERYGTLATTEAGDVADFNGNVPTSLTLAATEAPDHVAIAATVPASAVLNATEAADVASVTGYIIDVLAVSESPDAAAFVGLLRRRAGPVTIIQTN